MISQSCINSEDLTTIPIRVCWDIGCKYSYNPILLLKAKLKLVPFLLRSPVVTANFLTVRLNCRGREDAETMLLFRPEILDEKPSQRILRASSDSDRRWILEAVHLRRQVGIRHADRVADVQNSVIFIHAACMHASQSQGIGGGGG
jgi:hypothetical protein